MTRAYPEFWATVDDEFASEMGERPRFTFREGVFSPHRGPHDEVGACDELVAIEERSRETKGWPHSQDCIDWDQDPTQCIGEPCPATRMWLDGWRP